MDNRRFLSNSQKLLNQENLSMQELSVITQDLAIMIERQSEDDVIKLQELIFLHRRSCQYEYCICNFTHHLTVRQFRQEPEIKIQDKEPQIIKEKAMLPPVAQRSQHIFKLMQQATRYLLDTVKKDKNKEEEDIDISFTVSQQILDNKLPNLNGFDQTLDGSPGNNDSINMDIDIHVPGLKFEELFKDIFYNKNSQSGVNMPIKNEIQGKSNEEEVINKDEFKFKTQYDARKYLFYKLIGRYLRIIQYNQNADVNFSRLEDHLYLISFINIILEKNYLAIFHLMKLNNECKEMKFFDRIRFRVCEQLILKEAHKVIQINQGTFEYQSFIEANQQQIYLDQQYFEASSEILDFWKAWKSDNPDINLIMKQCPIISSRIKRIKQLTNEIQQRQDFKIDILNFQIYSIFFIDVLTDYQSYVGLRNFIRNHLLQNQLANNRHQKLHNFTNMGVCITRQSQTNFNQWEFMFTNKAFNNLFKFSDLQTRGQNVDLIIPKCIEPFHNMMIKRLYHDGNPRLIGKIRAILAKDKEGFIFPITIRVNFYYHMQLNYTLIGLFEKLKEINLFQDDTRISTEDAMFFLTDEDYNITDLSKNVLSFTGATIEQWELQKEMGAAQKLRMSNFVQDFDNILFQEFGSYTADETEQKGLANKLVRVMKYNEQNQCFDSSKVFDAVLTMIQENYYLSFHHFKLYIFVIIPFNKHPEFDIYMTQQTLKFNHTQKFQSINKASPFNTDMGLFQSHQSSNGLQLPGQVNYMNLSSMSSGSSNQSKSGLLTSQYAKGLLFQNRSPRDVKISIFILIGMYICFFIISIYNLQNFISKHADIEYRLESFDLIVHYRVHTRAAMLDLKMLQFIASDLQSLNKSKILPAEISRYKFYEENLILNAEIASELVKNFSDKIKAKEEYRQLNLMFDNLQFLSDLGYIYEQDVLYNHMVNLFVNNLGAINTTDILNQKPFLNVSNYAKNNSMKSANKTQVLNRKLTTLEKQMFFIFQNGLYKMGEIGSRQVHMLVETSSQQTDESIKTLNIATFISIAIVVILNTIAFPFLGRALERQYHPLHFFSYIKPNQIDNYLEQAKTFHNILKQKIEGEIKAFNTQFYEKDQMTQAKMRKSLIRKSSRMNLNKLNKTLKFALLQSKKRREKKEKKRRGAKELNFPDDVFEKASEKKNKDETEESKQNDEEKSEGSDEEPKKQYENLKDFTAQESQEQEREKLSIKNRRITILKQINRMLIRTKAKVLIFVLCLALYLNSSLFISFSQSQDIFANDKDGIQQLGKFFTREDCVYNIFLFMREEIIRNQHLDLKVYSSQSDYYLMDSVDHYIEMCQENEREIQNLRKNIPSYLQDAQDQLDYLESNQVCNKTFESIDPSKAPDCEQSLDKLLSNGQGNAIQYFLGFIQQTHLQFKTMGNSSYSEQLEFLKQEKLHQTIDFILYYFKDCFDYIQEAVRDSQIHATIKAKTNYILAFGIFFGLTSIASAILGAMMFRKIKKYLLDIQNILVLIPFEDLSQNQRLKIEVFVSK